MVKIVVVPSNWNTVDASGFPLPTWLSLKSWNRSMETECQAERCRDEEGLANKVAVRYDKRVVKS